MFNFDYEIGGAHYLGDLRHVLVLRFESSTCRKFKKFIFYFEITYFSVDNTFSWCHS